MATSDVITFDNSNFQDLVLNSDKPVLVDFWASWCGPCHAIAPTIERLAGRFADQVRVGKVNVDDNADLAGRFGVMSIPTVALFQGGQLVDRVVGAVPEGRLVDLIERSLPTGASR